MAGLSMLQLTAMTEEFELPIEPQRNPVTEQSFRRQVWLQVYLPFIGGLAVLAGVAAVLWTSGTGSASAWADASLILLLLPLILFSVIPIVLLIALIYGVSYLIKRIPVPANQAQQAIAQVGHTIQRAADQAVQPMVISKSGVFAARRVIQYFASIFR
jgi:hypothetical protein